MCVFRSANILSFTSILVKEAPTPAVVFFKIIPSCNLDPTSVLESTSIVVPKSTDVNFVGWWFKPAVHKLH